ncbi:hypothetical protein IAQ61_005602 [Plenodomus lingam]|uniref:DUF7719 domain-containing protein n=1 Tax=Leptosphaeria maculans (strain JN3 / isolate v23.1.3 / race Av1-4-5-6-7-8) TaxID=985895 RepID=E4ZYK5_LEPMJ|nr:hypothetical protein LEMA_P107960.1 [Plenodomus lingam JN3]KAH9871423.1 hypothetical protein IAQ61_005602 [Plenodomus lingam]CBX96531.1 hypothetical protein LEMA_P107960.1 [Plenodomus lingam JN3]
MIAGNRKQRRANANASSSTSQSVDNGLHSTSQIDEDGVEMILKHPDVSGPKGKTLFQLAEERQRELDREKAGRWGLGNTMASSAGSTDDAAVGPLGDALLYCTSMAALHLTLDVIVYSQYREDILWAEIIRRAAAATPVFMLLVYLTHVSFSYRFPILRDLSFLAGSVVSGCYLVYSANKHGYFYVMKAAPPVGTLWVWSVVEMSLPCAAMNVVAVLGYIWWNGFQFF